MSQECLERVRRILKRLRRDLNRFESGELSEIDIISYIDELGSDLSKVILASLDCDDPHPLIDVIDFTSSVDEGEITSLIFNMITLQLNAFLSVIHWNISGNIDRGKLFRGLKNDDVVNLSADLTIRAFEDGDLESALDTTISYLMLGFYSTIVGDEEGIDNALDYFIYTGLKLVDYDAISILFKTHIYLSYLLLNEIVKHDPELMRNLEKCRRRKLSKTEVARTFYKLVRGRRGFDRLKIEMEVNRKLADLIKTSLLIKNDWNVLREIRSFNWLYRKFSRSYGSIIENALYVLEGTVHAFNEDSEDIDLSEETLEVGEFIEDVDRTTVALISSALKMYKFGLLEAYRNILDGMKKLSNRGRDKKYLSRLADLLANLDPERKLRRQA